MFEGNALALEINHQTEDRHTIFPKALDLALILTALLVCLVGILSSAAYGTST